MKLIDRIKAEETKLGKVLAYYLPTSLTVIASSVEILEYLQTMPFEIGVDIKKWIAILTFIGFIGGKLTKKNEVHSDSN